MKFKQRQILLFLLIITSVIVILNDIVLNDVPEIFKRGDEIGQLLSNLSRAYISSYIFYFVVVVLKERKNKKNIYIAVYDLTKNLISRAYGVYHDIVSASGDNGKDYNNKTITKEQYRELCKIANPKGIPQNRIMGSLTNPSVANYGQFIYSNSVSHVKHYTEKIFKYMPFLDTEHVKLLNKLNNSVFFLVADSLTWPTKNTDFSAYSDNMYEFLEFVRELEDYNETEIKKHF